MLFLCPGCQRSFDEPGFCPFDRSQLISSAEARTVVSAAMQAVAPVAPAHATEIDRRRGTFPLTPSTPAARTDEITSARVRPAPPSPEPAARPRVQVLSASENPEAVLESYRQKRDNDYDKLVGQTLDGRYYVQKKIGEGGMGVVFSVRHAVIERPLAIKVLKREVMRDDATIRRFVQEAKAASRIGHPNIVDVTDFGTTPDGMTYSVMEYVTGQTLGTAIRAAAPFPMSRAARIAAQIARALGAAHDKGIIHRDLKPENVFLVDRDGRPDFVKIVDFGIAKIIPVEGASKPNEPRLTRAGSVFGTPEYMAPEQAAGRSDTDGRVDIYALGVILYEMITGRVPHRGDSMVRTLAMQMLDPVEPPSKVRPDLEITAELEALILKALAKKREHRFQTMGELLGALEALQTQVGVSMTGSPVYGLVPLPPGADPALAPSVPPAVQLAPLSVEPASAAPNLPLAAGASAPIQVARALGELTPAGRARTPTGPAGTTRRLKDEPEFVTHEKPITFEHVFTDEHAVPRRRRWPVLVLFALLFGGAGGAIALVAKSRGRAVVQEMRDAGPPGPEHLAAEPDAGIVEEPPALPDAQVDVIVGMRPDAAIRISPPPRPRDAGVVTATLPVTPNGRGTIGIQVLTKPEGATLYVGGDYRGPGGTTLEEPLGAKLEVTCKHAGYRDGTLKLVFDGKREAELCVLQRVVVCIPGVKNPFDQCPD